MSSMMDLLPQNPQLAIRLRAVVDVQSNAVLCVQDLVGEHHRSVLRQVEGHAPDLGLHQEVHAVDFDEQR